MCLLPRLQQPRVARHGLGGSRSAAAHATREQLESECPSDVTQHHRRRGRGLERSSALGIRAAAGPPLQKHPSPAGAAHDTRRVWLSCLAQGHDGTQCLPNAWPLLGPQSSTGGGYVSSAKTPAVAKRRGTPRPLPAPQLPGRATGPFCQHRGARWRLAGAALACFILPASSHPYTHSATCSEACCWKTVQLTVAHTDQSRPRLPQSGKQPMRTTQCPATDTLRHTLERPGDAARGLPSQTRGCCRPHSTSWPQHWPRAGTRTACQGALGPGLSG